MSSTPKPKGLIAVMGSTGSGKSSFVNAILGKPEATVSDGLESSTAEVAEYVHFHESGMEVRIVDTPGFNEYRTEGTNSDLKILQMIGAFLKKQYDANQKFSGIIFLHDINGAKVDWQTQRRNMTLFKKLCGTESMKNVVVATSFWDQLSDQSDGIQREHDLITQDGLLKELSVGGAKFVRSCHFTPGKKPHDPAFLTPKEIVDYLLDLDPVYVEMQKEMANGKAIADTAAGSSLLEEFERLKREVERTQARLNGWEKDGEETRMKLSRWEEYRAQIATKEELDALVSRHQSEFGGLQHEVIKLREANEKLRQIDQQRIDELNQTVARLRKERNDLAEECRALRSSNTAQFQGFWASLTYFTHTYHRETQRLQSLFASQGEELKQAKLAYAQTQKELDITQQLYAKSEANLKSSQEEVTRTKESNEKLSFLYDALEAEYNEILLASQLVGQELHMVRSDNQALESQNRELKGQLKEATSALDNTVAAADEFKLRFSIEMDDIVASMESEAQDLRSEKVCYQIDLEQRDQEIADLRLEVESLRCPGLPPKRKSRTPFAKFWRQPLAFTEWTVQRRLASADDR
ncbi:hypothetical protein BKA70DRAFT_1571973 [Coprinopsis sp. MPI-PUGE-AT-0042]|nr:hypothetical protein BKA70DRAFT_1571973 [Coprinopsis sp. MPI-PUGE-AT-0042]